MPDHAEVVADEQVGEPELGAQVVEQVDDLGLDRDVERRDRLVADHQLRLERERAGDADPLALAAAHLVRIALGEAPRQAAVLEQPVDPPGEPGAVLEAVHVERLADDLAHLHARVQGRVRVLEDRLHPAPEARRRLPVQAFQVGAVEAHLARGRRQQLEQAARDGALAAARIRRPGPAPRPSRSLKLTPSTAFTWPTARRNTIPLVTGKCFFRSWTSSNTGCPPHGVVMASWAIIERRAAAVESRMREPDAAGASSVLAHGDHRQAVAGLDQAGEVPRDQEPAHPGAIDHGLRTGAISRIDPGHRLVRLDLLAEIAAHLDHALAGRDHVGVLAGHG